MTHIAALGVPTRLLHRRSGCTKRKRRGKILNVKPHLLPVDDLVTQLIGDVLRFLPLVGNLTNMTIHFCHSRPSKRH